MKILELDLHAFGPFSSLRLDLSNGTEGLHVIYGPNEAGKSSALRALHALFYGVPERTTDDFLHERQDLRIGGRIRGKDDNEIVVYRRKGRKNTLLDDVDGNPLDDILMTRLLAGVDERLFSSLFGIDHPALVEGGESLLSAQGREAEALFGSGLGSTAVHSLLESFDNQARELFAPKASKPKINQLLKELKEKKSQLREISLSARVWEQARKAVQRADNELQKIGERIDEAFGRRSLLERVRRTLPNLAKRDEHRKRLDELGVLPELPDSFAEECQDALNDRAQANNERLIAETQIKNIGEQIKTIKYSRVLIEKADQIDDLKERLGTYRKANADLPKLLVTQEDRRQAAAENLKNIRPDFGIDDISGLRNAVGKRRRLTELGGKQGGQEAAVKAARSFLKKSNAELLKILDDLAQLEDVPDGVGLRIPVEAGRALGEIDQDITAEQSRLKKEARKIQSSLEALGLWAGGLIDFLSIPLPAAESIKVHVEAAGEIKEERASALKDRKQALADMYQADETLRRLELLGDIPTEAELLDVRSKRDGAWQLLRKKWLLGADISAESEEFGGVEGLPGEFEHRIQAADDTADRLRREAQKVHENSTAHARRENCENIIAEIDTVLERLTARESESSDKWAQLWQGAGIEPRTPVEMAAWISSAEGIRERISELEQKKDKFEARIGKRRAVVEELVRELKSVGIDVETPQDRRLQPVLTEAESRLESIENLARRLQHVLKEKEALERKVLGQKDDLAEIQQERESWREQWQSSLRELGLSAKYTVSEVLDYMDACDSVIALVKDVDDLELRIAGIQADNDRFLTDLRDLVSEVAADLSGIAAPEAMTKLARRLTEDRKSATRDESLSEQLDEARDAFADADVKLVAKRAKLNALCEQAGCDEPEELLAVGRQVMKRDALTREIKNIEDELLEGGDGLTIEQLQEEAGEVDRDQLSSQIQKAVDGLDGELLPQQRRLIEEKAEQDRAFSDMAGEDDAAEIAEETQRIISELQELSREYVRSKIAGRVLRDQVERFRQQHRSPILAKASYYFQRLTCESFSEITTTLDDADLPVLVAVRSSGERLRVDGMSTGTRDQLYFALRLATLEHYAEGAEPLPFIVDDVLIQFDDDRSAATLDALAELSARTQVIVFTHHRQVVEQAGKIASQNNEVFIHELPHLSDGAQAA